MRKYMLNIIYLISIILGVSAQNIFKKPYTDKTGGQGVYLFNTILSFTAMLFFVFTTKDLRFHSSLSLYAIGFAITYILAIVFSVKAISCGSVSLTSLFVSYSLMIPTFYGMIFLKDPLSDAFVVGIVLLVLSLLLINKKDKHNTISLKWLFYVFLAFFGNGMCTVVQKMQQVASDGAYKNEFMIIALSIVTIVMLLLALTTERKQLSFCVKSGLYWAMLCGVMNGMVNLFVMILSGRMPVSLMFPMISAGGIIVTYIVSRFAYKEKMSTIQFVGFLIGIASVVFLNI